MATKICKCCGELKPYFPEEKRGSKASGFYKARCWACYCVAKREVSREDKRRLVTDPTTGEVITAGALSHRRLVTDPATGEVIRAGALAMRKRTASGLRAEYMRNRLTADPLFKLSQNLSCLIRCALKAKGYRKNTKTQALLGCSYEQFRAHLEAQFTEGMTWENFGEWHLDHILPCAAAKNETELLALQHYSNFQPMWGFANLQKGTSLPDGWEASMALLIDQAHTASL